MMEPKTTLLICNTDVKKILGTTYSRAKVYMSKMRADLQKEPGQSVTVQEFAEYSGLPIQEVILCIKSWQSV